jgi:hypothetical protein
MFRLRCLLPAALLVALCSPSPAAAWETLVPGLHDLTDSLLEPQIDPEGNVVVATTFEGGCPKDFLVTSLAAADGAIRWRRESSSDRGSNSLSGVAMDRRGDVVAVGSTDGRNDCCETCRARQAVFKLDAASALVDDQPRGLRSLKRAARALSVAEGLTERRSHATRGDCRKGIHRVIATIRQTVEHLRRDLAEVSRDPPAA